MLPNVFRPRLVASIAATLLTILLHPMTFVSATDRAITNEVPYNSFSLSHNAFEPDHISMAIATVHPEHNIAPRQAQTGAATLINDNLPQDFDLKPGEGKSFMFLVQPQRSGGNGKIKLATGAKKGSTSAAVDPDSELDSDSDSDDDDDDHRRVDKMPGSNKRLGSDRTAICISANVCRQPDNTNTATQAKVHAPQLTMYISNATSNKLPGPAVADSKTQQVHQFRQGAFMLNFLAATNVYFTIVAPNVTMDFEGQYNIQLSVSSSSCQFRYDDKSSGNITHLGSDSSGAMLVIEHGKSANVSSFSSSLFVLKADDAWKADGLMLSYCGLRRSALIIATAIPSSPDGVPNRHIVGQQPFQQFFLDSLKQDTSYVGVLAKLQQGSFRTVTTVFSKINFATEYEGGTCELLHDLGFCEDVLYAVPGNKTRFPTKGELRAFYDSYLSGLYDNFKLALAQIQCEAPPAQAYSLVRNCSDCANAYKSWLCTVAIPRCHETPNYRDPEKHYLMPRNFRSLYANGSAVPDDIIKMVSESDVMMLNMSSRSNALDKQLMPGPYLEMLPCDNVCYQIIQSCPAALGFRCPRPRGIGFNYSYIDSRTDTPCNNPIGMPKQVAPHDRGWGATIVLGVALIVGLGIAMA